MKENQNQYIDKNNKNNKQENNNKRSKMIIMIKFRSNNKHLNK